MDDTHNIAIFGGGDLDDGFIDALRGDEIIIGVDRGAFWLLTHDVIPHVAIGDFDSVSQEEMGAITTMAGEVRMFPPEKSQTDMELAALDALERKPRSVVIYGGMGGRLDHTMGVIHLLTRFLDRRIPAVLRDRQNELFLVDGKVTLTPSDTFRYVSLIPFGMNAQVSLDGFKYPVDRQVFLQGSTLGISNEVTGPEATITVHEGLVLVIRSRDVSLQGPMI